jgi:hypothetical protein
LGFVIIADLTPNFSLFITFGLPEGRPDNTGVEMARELNAARIPVKLILDAGVAFYTEKVDMVLVGAEGVVESGGIINYLGTFQVALVARSMNKPVYVAAESYKVPYQEIISYWSEQGRFLVLNLSIGTHITYTSIRVFVRHRCLSFSSVGSEFTFVCKCIVIDNFGYLE